MFSYSRANYRNDWSSEVYLDESSGKQGYEIASQLAINGVKVILISDQQI